nr:right-handed parallel beta-helix repeat-containing protein [uncultured Steroidobacter sp.]
MPFSRRSAVSIVVFVLLGVFVGLGYWYESRKATPGQAVNSPSIDVTSGDDRGPGSLREAIFKATAATGEVTIALKVSKITLASTLPPLANAAGIRVVADEHGTEIDASALPAGAVLDVSGPNISIEGVRIPSCKETGIVLRAERFKLQTTSIENCDVGIDVAENADQLLLERNHFAANRVGVRFAASNKNALVVKNEFSGHRDAGIWAVRSEPDKRGGAISIRDNRFNKERIGILSANVSLIMERNELLDSREAAMQLMGSGAVARGNRISRGAAMGIVVENGQAAVIEDNELDGLEAYGVMLKGSADTVIRNNRIHNSGYGLAFVLGNQRSPSSAIDNTIIEPKFNGIDVIGDSPILRGNQVLRPRALALKITDYQPEGGGEKVRAVPFLEGNNFSLGAATVAAGDAKPSAGGVVQR